MKKMTMISRDQINSWNRIANEMAGTPIYYKVSLFKEYKEGSKWMPLNHSHSIRACYTPQTGERFFLKTIKDNTYLYWENCSGTDSERWLLNEMAMEFFKGLD